MKILSFLRVLVQSTHKISLHLFKDQVSSFANICSQQECAFSSDRETREFIQKQQWI